jgi:flavodoxin
MYWEGGKIMKTGIIIHSNTNNTLSVGERLLNTLQAKGRDAELERVISVNADIRPGEKIRLAAAPAAELYDLLIIGAPVHGFALAPVMAAYLKQLNGIRGKKVACFVTEYFPKPWMGGNKAVMQMAALVAQGGGIVTQTAVVNWSSKKREEQIDRLVAAFSDAL